MEGETGEQVGVKLYVTVLIKTLYVRANTRLMDKITDVDYKEANVDRMERTIDIDSDSLDFDYPVKKIRYFCVLTCLKFEAELTKNFRRKLHAKR